MEESYIDAFFEDGSLRLSSFVAFSKHADEERKDVREGLAVGSLTDGQMTAIIGAGFGSDYYVLCGSTSTSDQVRDAFGQNAIAINDVTAFSSAVANALPNFVSGMEGSCNYSDERIVRKTLEDGQIQRRFDANSGDDGSIDMKILTELTEHQSIESMFLKDRRYEHQSEYRVLWQCDAIQTYIDVKVPRARQFCSRFSQEFGKKP